MDDGDRPASDASAAGGATANDDAGAAGVADGRHVLVAYDGTPQSETALAHACRHHPDARMTVLHAIDPVAAGYSAEVSLPSVAEDWYESERARARSLLEDASETAREYAVEVETTVEVGRPPAAVVEYAEEHHVDHVVLGSHGRTGLSRVLVGSVAEAVVRRSSVPVTVVR